MQNYKFVYICLFEIKHHLGFMELIFYLFIPLFRTTIEKVGFSDMTLDLLAQCLSRKSSEIKVCT